MSDLRKAAEMALEALEYIHTETSKDEDELIHSAIESLRQALSQTEQECIYPECETSIGCDGPCGEKPVDETAKRGHEPVAFGFQNTAITESNRWMMLRETIPANDQYQGALWTPLYTAPPKREWKGLTSDDKHFLLANSLNKEHAFDGFMEAIDKFLEEKNT